MRMTEDMNSKKLQPKLAQNSREQRAGVLVTECSFPSGKDHEGREDIMAMEEPEFQVGTSWLPS
jgi:hypothetical protein